MRHRDEARRSLGRTVLFLLVFAAGEGGCVLRTLEVQSKPAGAVVYLDDQPVGTTPCTLPFDYYGTRAIRLAKTGYRPHQGEVELAAPWYEWFPLDFFSEILWPGVIRDRHDYAVTLEKIEPDAADAAATAEFLERAQRRLLESRVEGYIRRIAVETAAIDEQLAGPSEGGDLKTLRARRVRLREALAALTTAAGSLADLARWEAAHRAAVRGE
jgi:hypothetical protein